MAPVARTSPLRWPESCIQAICQHAGLDNGTRLALEKIFKGDNSTKLPIPPFPPPPWEPDAYAGAVLQGAKLLDRLRQIQKFIERLQYNYTSLELFTKRKDRGWRHVISTARQIIRDSLPIQCVEACFVGACLTCGIKGLTRLPLSFKSTLEGTTHRHIVMAVQWGQKWGAIGISRRSQLMWKELRYNSLSELVQEFSRSYSDCWHELLSVRIGFPFPHSAASSAPIKWSVLHAARNAATGDWTEALTRIDSFMKCLPKLHEHFLLTSKLPTGGYTGSDEEERSQAAEGGQRSSERRAKNSFKRTRRATTASICQRPARTAILTLRRASDTKVMG
jgi:hypothetical protein